MSTLLQSIRERETAANQRKADEQAATLQRYRALVNRAETPEEGDAEALALLMETLGLTAADVESDLAALAGVREADAATLTPEQLAAAAKKVETVLDEVADAQVGAICTLSDRLQRERACRKFVLDRALEKALGEIAMTGWLKPHEWEDLDRIRRDANRRPGDAEFEYKAIVTSHEKAKAKAEQIRKGNPRLFDADAPQAKAPEAPKPDGPVRLDGTVTNLASGSLKDTPATKGPALPTGPFSPTLMPAQALV